MGAHGVVQNVAVAYPSAHYPPLDERHAKFLTTIIESLGFFTAVSYCAIQVTPIRRLHVRVQWLRPSGAGS